MAVSYEVPIQVDFSDWRIRFHSNRVPPVDFRVFVEGRLVSSFTSPNGSGSVDVAVADQSFLWVEAVDYPMQAPLPGFPGRFTVHWQAVAGASGYSIEEFVDPVWEPREFIDNDGRGAWSWQSRWLPSVYQAQFRVTPWSQAENPGDQMTLSGLMVRHEDLPDAVVAYDGPPARTVTISQA